LSFEKLFPFKPNAMQTALCKLMTRPGLFVVEAPMGIGKTEAALAAAYHRWTHGDERGLYFALPTSHFNVLTVGQGISGTFRSVIDPGGPAFQATYQNGIVDLTSGTPQKAAPVFAPSDGTPSSTTALISDYAFFNSWDRWLGVMQPGLVTPRASPLTVDSFSLRDRPGTRMASRSLGISNSPTG
jgi:hypothetical protein